MYPFGIADRHLSIDYDSVDTNHIAHIYRFFPDMYSNILWMEEILHQLVDGLSHCNPIIYSVL